MNKNTGAVTDAFADKPDASHLKSIQGAWQRAADKHGEQYANDIFPTGKPTDAGNAPRVDEATRSLIAELKEFNPSRQFAIEEKGGSLGVWDKLESRFCLIASRAITGEWVLTQQDILVNDKAILRNWIGV